MRNLKNLKNRFFRFFRYSLRHFSKYSEQGLNKMERNINKKCGDNSLTIRAKVGKKMGGLVISSSGPSSGWLQYWTQVHLANFMIDAPYSYPVGASITYGDTITALERFPAHLIAHLMPVMDALLVECWPTEIYGEEKGWPLFGPVMIRLLERRLYVPTTSARRRNRCLS